MRSDANAGATDADAGESEHGDYDWMLETLDDGIREAQRKVKSGRVYDVENEKVRIRWIRALAYSLNVRQQIENDRTLEELAEMAGVSRNSVGSHIGLLVDLEIVEPVDGTPRYRFNTDSGVTRALVQLEGELNRAAAESDAESTKEQPA